MGFLRQADIRYVGQSYELTLPLPERKLNPAEIARVLEQFHREHDRAYGFSAPGELAEFVALRLTATGKIAKPRVREWEQDGSDAASAQKETRSVFFAESGGYVACPIYDRSLLGAGCVVRGPAVVEERDATTVIHPEFQVQVDRFGNLILTHTSL